MVRKNFLIVRALLTIIAEPIVEGVEEKTRKPFILDALIWIPAQSRICVQWPFQLKFNFCILNRNIFYIYFYFIYYVCPDELCIISSNGHEHGETCIFIHFCIAYFSCIQPLKHKATVYLDGKLHRFSSVNTGSCFCNKIDGP